MVVDGKRDARNRYFSLSVVTCAKQTNPTAVNPFVPLCDGGGMGEDATILSSRHSELGANFQKDPHRSETNWFRGRLRVDSIALLRIHSKSLPSARIIVP